ncbi:DUF6265 family protein [uncultured Formosa sp.]|uniref:DUF6265 family protein n=1 Tax=uncultured Formosa sp. TaxID=255435 RepID=UPI0026326BB6|nr:DUF6265 family protein [uncultured Formosa sp.]
MKKLLIVCLGLLICSCNQDKKETPKVTETPTVIAEKSENFDWLLGAWKRLNEEEGKDTFEHWNKISATEYVGIGFTMQHGDTIKQEHIQLIKQQESWNLKVKTPDEQDWITFKGINHTSNNFTCENTEIEFPNQIKYWIDGEKLHAMVSSVAITIPFEFEKTK